MPAGGHSDWDGEMDLDVEWAHAIAPKAKILLVEAFARLPTPTYATRSIMRVVQPGVVAVSMSWGGGNEFSTELSYDSTFTTPAGRAGVAFVASAGISWRRGAMAGRVAQCAGRRPEPA